MKGAKRALIQPIRINRLCNLLYARLTLVSTRQLLKIPGTHAAMSSFLFRSLTNCLLTCPSAPKRKPSKQNLRFHSKTFVSRAAEAFSVPLGGANLFPSLDEMTVVTNPSFCERKLKLLDFAKNAGMGIAVLMTFLLKSATK